MAANIDESTNLSDYAKNLKADVLARHKFAMKLCDVKDPYALKKCDDSYDIAIIRP